LHNNLDKNDSGLLITSKDDVKEFYGVYLTGQLDADSNRDWLDANKSIMIGCNYDEEAICLDYRFSKEFPRIVASDYSKSNKSGRWKEIAKSIDELIIKLGIRVK